MNIKEAREILKIFEEKEIAPFGDGLMANGYLNALYGPEVKGLLEVSRLVLRWWEEHKYDTDDVPDGEYTESFNRYDEEPDFVIAAKEASETFKRDVDRSEK